MEAKADRFQNGILASRARNRERTLKILGEFFAQNQCDLILNDECLFDLAIPVLASRGKDSASVTILAKAVGAKMMPISPLFASASVEDVLVGSPRGFFGGMSKIRLQAVSSAVDIVVQASASKRRSYPNLVTI